MDEVAVVLGVGGMGSAIARRLGLGRRVVIADRDAAAVNTLAAAMSEEGFDVVARTLDVTDHGAVADLARESAGLGHVVNVVHTAGVSPTHAAVAAILQVDLLGTAHVLDAFGAVIARGGAGVVIASMAGTIFAGALSAEDESILASAPITELLNAPAIRLLADNDDAGSRSLAYGIAKRANQLRVQAAAPIWGARGARVNSISPGVISTAMGRAELDDPITGQGVGAMISSSPVGRVGTVTDIAAIADFLLSPAAGYITGTDVLADGGVVAAMLRPQPVAAI